MNAYLNYIIEVNLSLLLFLVFYTTIFRKETNFRLLRLFLVAGIVASLLFPLIHVADSQNISAVSISKVIPTYWLPEVFVGGEAGKTYQMLSLNVWAYITFIYAAGVTMIFLMLVVQLISLAKIITTSATYRIHNLRIAESPEDKPTFSFFNFVFIGRADLLSPDEKEQIINHESVHANQWHSFDMLLVNAVRILFWYNPWISTYKKKLVELHEFEADARTVRHTDMNQYCNLLAKVALQSAKFTLANHFNNSLSLKRIEMMRTFKSNIQRWKLVAMVVIVPVLFFFVSCQEQISDDIAVIAQNSTHALIAPAEVRQRFEQLKREHPYKKYAMLELNETASQSLKNLEAEYGLPSSIEVFNSSENETGLPAVKELIILSNSEQSSYSEIAVSDTESKSTFAIVEFNNETSKLTDAAQEGQVFTVVQQMPEYPGGSEAMHDFLNDNLNYPEKARKNNEQGTVYVSFIVEKDGSVSEVKSIRGVSQMLDEEAQRVVNIFPNWKPGKQNGETVRVRFVMPIRFQ